MTGYDFGIRSIPPCSDCWEDGHCSMNCGPAAKSIIQISEEEKVSKNAKIRASVAKSLQKIARDMRNVAPLVKKMSPENGDQMEGAAQMLDDWAEEIENV